MTRDTHLRWTCDMVWQTSNLTTHLTICTDDR